jgi:chromate reductase
MIKILGIPGSLRKGSYNKALLNAAVDLKPEDMNIEIFDIASIPLYNGDVETEGTPTAVNAFKNKIAEADALLIVTPEYNYSIPGVLKNAIDWA